MIFYLIKQCQLSIDQIKEYTGNPKKACQIVDMLLNEIPRSRKKCLKRCFSVLAFTITITFKIIKILN